MLKSLTPRTNRSAINEFAMSQNSDPMMVQARALGVELAREELERKYEIVCLVAAFSLCVNIGMIIWFTIYAVNQIVSF